MSARMWTSFIFVFASFSSYADVTYRFPEAGTEIRFTCKETPPQKSSGFQFTGSFTFKEVKTPPEGIDEKELYLLDIKTSNGINMSHIRAPWQIPFNIFSVTIMKSGQFKELLSSEKQRPSPKWKLGETRTVSTIRTYFNDSTPVRFLLLKDLTPVYTHNTTLRSKQTTTTTVNGTKRQVETYHSISRVKNTKSGESYQWEVHYSPELKWATQTKRTQTDGTVIECWSKEWVLPKKNSTSKTKVKKDVSDK